jgi:hypothetical protein
MIKLSYKKSGTNAEPSFLSFWQTGLTNMGSESAKQIKEFQVYYTGTSGTLTIAFVSDNGTERSFNIDLSISPTESTTDAYFGTDENKVFVYIPDFSDQLISRFWRFKVSENGTEEWKVQRIVARVTPLPYTTRQGDL